MTEVLAGEVSADYWPTGQPRHKRLKRGKLRIDEWYHPSGAIQKGYVADKTGYAIEPVRLWHDNGQLAEEIHTKEGDKIGPWPVFFVGENEIIAGRDNKHMDFRLSVLKVRSGEASTQ